jgi:hypothetical protein
MVSKAIQKEEQANLQKRARKMATGCVVTDARCLETARYFSELSSRFVKQLTSKVGSKSSKQQICILLFGHRPRSFLDAFCFVMLFICMSLCPPMPRRCPCFLRNDPATPPVSVLCNLLYSLLMWPWRFVSCRLRCLRSIALSNPARRSSCAAIVLATQAP